ncbi:MAG: P-loop NTPase [Clostridiales bacterium]|nr:P-loop NTPase [Clostridiales bacterium]MCF8022678.1 P-loop NTPase [Clostridiales bacterium]
MFTIYCVLAVEEQIARIIQSELQNMEPFNTWHFEICGDVQYLDDYSRKKPDVLVLSRFLSGEKPSKLLQHIQTLFPGSHIVLLVGELDEQARGYLRQAKKYGLNNYVTGDALGERPYMLPVALQNSRTEVVCDTEEELDSGTLDQSAGVKNREIKECEHDNDDVFWGTKTDTFIDVNDPVYETKPEKQQPSKDEKSFEHEDTIIPFQKMKKEQPEKKRQVRKGVFVLATSNKGGVGKTTTAVTIAVALARSGIPVVLTDFDFEAPDVASFFDIKDVPGIESLVGRTINPYYLEELLVEKEDNLYVLPGVMDRTIPFFERDQVSELTDLLLNSFPVVVGDTPPGFWTKDWIPELMEKADIIYSIVNQSKLSEKETMDYAPKLIECGVDEKKIRIVLNQFSPRLHDAKKIEKYFVSGFKGVPKDKLPQLVATIPQDWDNFNKQMYKGEVAGLDDVYSQWYRLVEEVAAVSGIKINRPEKKGKKGLSGLFDWLKKK